MAHNLKEPQHVDLKIRMQSGTNDILSMLAEHVARQNTQLREYVSNMGAHVRGGLKKHRRREENKHCTEDRTRLPRVMHNSFLKTNYANQVSGLSDGLFTTFQIALQCVPGAETYPLRLLLIRNVKTTDALSATVVPAGLGNQTISALEFLQALVALAQEVHNCVDIFVNQAPFEGPVTIASQLIHTFKACTQGNPLAPFHQGDRARQGCLLGCANYRFHVTNTICDQEHFTLLTSLPLAELHTEAIWDDLLSNEAEDMTKHFQVAFADKPVAWAAFSEHEQKRTQLVAQCERDMGNHNMVLRLKQKMKECRPLLKVEKGYTWQFGLEFQSAYYILLQILGKRNASQCGPRHGADADRVKHAFCLASHVQIELITRVLSAYAQFSDTRDLQRKLTQMLPNSRVRGDTVMRVGSGLDTNVKTMFFHPGAPLIEQAHTFAHLSEMLHMLVNADKTIDDLLATRMADSQARSRQEASRELHVLRPSRLLLNLTPTDRSWLPTKEGAEPLPGGSKVLFCTNSLHSVCSYAQHLIKWIQENTFESHRYIALDSVMIVKALTSPPRPLRFRVLNTESDVKITVHQNMQQIDPYKTIQEGGCDTIAVGRYVRPTAAPENYDLLYSICDAPPRSPDETLKALQAQGWGLPPVSSGTPSAGSLKGFLLRHRKALSRLLLETEEENCSPLCTRGSSGLTALMGLECTSGWRSTNQEKTTEQFLAAGQMLVDLLNCIVGLRFVSDFITILNKQIIVERTNTLKRIEVVEQARDNQLSQLGKKNSKAVSTRLHLLYEACIYFDEKMNLDMEAFVTGLRKLAPCSAELWGMDLSTPIKQFFQLVSMQEFPKSPWNVHAPRPEDGVDNLLLGLNLHYGFYAPVVYRAAELCEVHTLTVVTPIDNVAERPDDLPRTLEKMFRCISLCATDHELTTVVLNVFDIDILPAASQKNYFAQWLKALGISPLPKNSSITIMLVVPDQQQQHIDINSLRQHYEVVSDVPDLISQKTQHDLLTLLLVLSTSSNTVPGHVDVGETLIGDFAARSNLMCSTSWELNPYIRDNLRPFR